MYTAHGSDSALVLFSAPIVAAGTEFQHIGFRDPASAGRSLARIAELGSGAIAGALVPVLTGVPDPDLAVNLLARLLEEHHDAVHVLEPSPVLIHYAAAIFGHSQWLGETLIQAPDLLNAMLRDKSLGRSLTAEEFAERFARFRSRAVEQDTATLLARFKRREYVRVMLRDVLGVASLAETTSELSAIADVLIAEALRVCDQSLRNRYGAPQCLDAQGRLVDAPFAVVALGKHGGNELNYSSDIDLLYLFRDGDEPAGTRITNREYFIRLAQDLTAMLSHSTPEGAPFRIDLRLRPQGNEGEPAVGLRHALDYYAKRAADWELQALIKVRHAAGDQKLGREFIRRVQPLVYTEKLNFAAIETAVLSGEKIQSHRRRTATRHADEVDVKLDRGGIRDIEFLVQCLQRVYGGRETWLRSGGTMFSLQKLHDKGHISGHDFHELTSAYEFLRIVEHRLQLRLGQQVHKLPVSDDRLTVLARALSPRLVPVPSTALLLMTLRTHMQAVRRIYDRIIHQQHIAERAAVDEEFRLTSSMPQGREASQREILERLAVDAPQLYRKARQEFAPHARANLFRFLSAAFTTSDRYRELLETQDCFEAVLQVVSSSDFLTSLLVRHPEEIAALADIHEVEGHTGTRLLEFASVPTERSPFVEFLSRATLDRAEKVALIRRQYRSRVFASGARDILHRRRPFDSLAETSDIALESIAAALALVPWPEGLAVFALGRLGTCEFDILSDADLVFVRDDAADPLASAAAASEIIQMLSAYTRDGTLFPVDARLRPHGTAGELVVTPGELLRYFQADAQAWEALTWTKLRLVSGPEKVRDQVFSAAAALFQRHARSTEFIPSLLNMRERLESSEERESLRTGSGGLYDLDFIAGSGLVRLDGSPRFGGNLRQRFEMLCHERVLTADECSALMDAAELLRALEHAIRLATGLPRKSLPHSGYARDAVEALVRGSLAGIPEGLESAISSCRAQVRAIFSRLFA